MQMLFKKEKKKKKKQKTNKQTKQVKVRLVGVKKWKYSKWSSIGIPLQVVTRHGKTGQNFLTRPKKYLTRT